MTFCVITLLNQYPGFLDLNSELFSVLSIWRYINNFWRALCKQLFGSQFSFEYISHLERWNKKSGNNFLIFMITTVFCISAEGILCRIISIVYFDFVRVHFLVGRYFCNIYKVKNQKIVFSQIIISWTLIYYAYVNI